METKHMMRHDAGRVRSWARTSVVFGLFVTFFHVVLWLVAPENDPLQLAVTRIVVTLVNLCGITAVASASEIIMPKAHWIVAPECTAINAYIVFASFVLAYAASATRKVVAIGLGVPFLFVANIARLVSLACITDRYPQYASWFHNYIWQGVFMLVIVLMWMVWIEWMANIERQAPIPK